MKEKVKEFFKENGKMIAGAAITAGLYVLSRKFGIPLLGGSISSTRPTDIFSSPKMFYPRNSIETSIVSVFESAMTLDFDSDRKRAADDICAILAKNECDDNTKSLTINVLSEIAKKCDFGSAKRHINNLIVNM